MTVAAALAQLVELVQQPRCLPLDRRKIRFVLYDEPGPRRAVLAEWLFSDELLADHPRDELPDKRLSDGSCADRHFERARGVLQHLRGRHLAPLPDGIGAQRRNAPDDVLMGLRVKQ